jgi:hypothetical protein
MKREKREKKLSIKVTATEHAKITKLSKESKQTISDYVVKKTLSVKNRKEQK